ncbi:MAG: cysteine--tRNA ligase [Bacilli bacterium]
MRIYNTYTKQIEDFKPKNKNNVTMYTCGPTVYNYAHIGNLRTFIFEDILEKTLNYLDFKVKRVMNITDVGHLTDDGDNGEDKMSKSAKEQNKDVETIAQYYTDKFLSDLKELNIAIPKIVEKATNNIDMYIKVIEKLLENGYAYKGDNGNIYFDVSKYENYYELSKLNSESLSLASRDDVEIDENKKNPNDFVLWFVSSKFDNHLQIWDSPFGKGYPGWHIECTGISLKYLGEYLDIHCGGIDLVFPHHTNEIAQSEAYLGHKWCSYFVHSEYLNDKHGKMSKSKGDFLTLNKLIEKGYNPLIYRLFCLMSHYRNQLVFSYESLDNASNVYESLKKKIATLKSNEENENDLYIERYLSQFKSYISDDLNTSNVITLIFNCLKEDINDNTKIHIIRQIDKILSLDLFKRRFIDMDKLKKAKNLLEARAKAKQGKNFILADKLREEIKSLGFEIEDTKNGSKVIY